MGDRPISENQLDQSNNTTHRLPFTALDHESPYPVAIGILGLYTKTVYAACISDLIESSRLVGSHGEVSYVHSVCLTRTGVRTILRRLT